MANSYLPVQDVTADYKLETATFNVDGTNVVHRERVMLAGNTASSIWDIVNAAPPSNSYGPVVRTIGMYTQSGDVMTNDTLDSLQVSIVSSVPGTASINSGKAIDSAAGATDTGFAVLVIRDDALSALTPAEGDYAPLRVNSTGSLYVTGAGGGTQFVEDVAHVTGDTGTFALAIRADTLGAAGGIAGTTGDYIGLQTDAFGAQWTRDVFKTSAGVDMTNTTLNALNTVVTNVAAIGGNVAHDGVDTPQNPVLTGAYALAHGTTPTAVAAADVTRLYANREGLPWVIGGAPNVISREITITDADGAQSDLSLLGAIGAGTKAVVTRVGVVCDADNTVSVGCRIGFATVNMPTATNNGVNGIVLSHPDIPAGSGYTVGTGSGIIAVGADGEELRMTCEDPVTGSLVVCVSYYTTAS